MARADERWGAGFSFGEGGLRARPFRMTKLIRAEGLAKCVEVGGIVLLSWARYNKRYRFEQQTSYAGLFKTSARFWDFGNILNAY